MVSKEDILTTLEKLDEKYSIALRSDSPQDATFYAKLALLEYCGWLEETFDDIVRESIKGELETGGFRDFLEKKIIRPTYGFQYDDHFIPMLMKAIGIVKVEKLASELRRDEKLDVLKAELGQVKKARNDAAHTWLKGATQTYQAPSWIKSRLDRVYPIMDLINQQVLTLKEQSDS